MPKLPDLTGATAFDENLREIPARPGRIARGVRLARARLDEARAAGDGAQVLRVLGYLADACRVAGQLDDAVAYAGEALDLARAAGNRNAEIANLIRLAEARKYRGEHAAAETLQREALALAGPDDAHPLRDYALQHLGKNLLEQGRHDEAIACLDDALTLRREKGQPSLVDSTEQALTLARKRAIESRRR
jgi:tetratricopeptide (TPR) repeat protein